MKKLTVLLCLFLFCSAIFAQSNKKIFSESYRDGEYTFEVKRALNSNNMNSLQNDAIYYILNHRRAGFMGQGLISLPLTEIPKRTHVKSMKISADKLVIKMEDGYEYKYLIRDNNFYLF